MKVYSKCIIGIVIGILLFSGCSSKKEEVVKSDIDGAKPSQVEEKELEEVALEPDKENEIEASSKASEPKEFITAEPDDKVEKPVTAPKTEEKSVNKPAEAPKGEPVTVEKPVEEAKEEAPVAEVPKVEAPKTEAPPVAPYLDRNLSNQLLARLLKYAPSSTNNHNRDSNEYSGTVEFHNKINSLVDRYTTNSITESQLRAEIMALDGVERWSSLEEDINRYHQIFQIVKIGKKEFPKGSSIEAMNEGVGRQMMEYGNYIYSSILVDGDKWIAAYVTIKIYTINK